MRLNCSENGCSSNCDLFCLAKERENILHDDQRVIKEETEKEG